MVIRIPRAAIDALRGQVEGFLGAHGLVDGACLEDTALEATSLGEFLLAALAYVREERPWIGRKGAVLAAPEDYPAGTLAALVDALPAYDTALTTDACLAALQRLCPLEIVDAPCGHRRPRPRVFHELFFALPAVLRDADLSHCMHLVVAEPRWLADPARRDEVFGEVLPANHEPAAFVELDPGVARTLAGFLFAGPARRAAHTAYRAQAAAFVQLLGPTTRCFGSEGLRGGLPADPFDPATRCPSAWSRYDASGAGSWGSTLALLVTDGLRVAYLDALWDVTGE